ncbi:hypothetical protein [Streptomyces sp. NPDC015125]|uniref:hypothetical protein n=1 Tax=Streptomyces sp. NPDC015125 TaxID=3364938 RepID=UPI0036F75A99
MRHRVLLLPDLAPAWLDVLNEHAEHLLLANEVTGAWPAAPCLEHSSAPGRRVAPT